MKKITLILALLLSFQTFSQKVNFDAKAIIAISDADMAASAYTDGKLLKEKGAKDAFTVINFPIEKYGDEPKNVFVSNSSTGNIKSMVLSENNKLAYIIESRGVTNDNLNEVKNAITDLPMGSFVTVVDISELSQPKVLFKFPVGKNPIGIEKSPKGDYLAIWTEESGKELQVMELDNAGKPIRIINKPATMQSGKISDICWHPDGNFVAYTLEDSRQVGLLKTVRDGPTTKIIRLDISGSLMKVGNFPGAGQFTPNGKFYLIPDLKLGEDAKSAPNYDGTGDMFVMKFNYDGTGEHFLLTKIKLGEKPQGFSISPDGNLAIVVNARKTFFAWENPLLTTKASLTLLKIPDDGMLQNIGEYEFEGILPESVAFDKNGENIAVTVFDYFNYGKHFGGIEFWKVNKGEKPSLQKQAIKYYVPRGVHAIKVVK